jgi:hypothetical protein
MALSVSIQLVGLDRAQEGMAALARNISGRMPELFRVLGYSLVENVQHRIITRDSGRWAPASKWTRAKTGYNFPTLLGAERYVRQRVTSKALTVYGATGKSWTLTQHHEGFTNALKRADEETDEHGRVIIPIKDGAPLNLYQEFRKKRDGTTTPRAQVFAFVPKKVGITPARKIWPNEAEVKAIAQPIADAWLKKVVSEATGA